MGRIHRMLSRRMLAMALALLLTVPTVLALVGCARVEERRIESEVTEALDRFKDLTPEEAATSFGELGLDLSGLEGVGLDTSSFAQHLLAGFDYRIDEVIVEGSHATVELNISSHDNLTVVRQLSEEYAVQGDDYVALMLGQDADRALTEDFFAELFRRVDEQSTDVSHTVTLSLDKSNGAWQADAASESELVRAMLGLES